MDESGVDKRVAVQVGVDRWESALNSARATLGERSESEIRSSRCKIENEFELASKVFIVGLIFLVISFALFAYAMEKSETSLSGDDYEKIENAAKWSSYTRYVGEIVVIAGLIGMAIGLSRTLVRSK